MNEFKRELLEIEILKINNCDEIFKPIKNTNRLYWVSNKGCVISLQKNKIHILKPGIQKGNLLHVNLPIGKNNKFTSKKIHQLVLETFVGERNSNLIVRHLNGIPSDNRLENLSYGTTKDNSQDGVRLGETSKGIKNGMVKLNENQIKEIRKLYRTGNYTHKQLSKVYSISRRHIGDIINKVCWGWLNED